MVRVRLPGPRLDEGRHRGAALNLHFRALALLATALCGVACTRPSPSEPPRPSETCARLGALYAKERLPFEASECVRMVTEMAPEGAACFARCTSSATVKALVSCQTQCSSPPRE